MVDKRIDTATRLKAQAVEKYGHQFATTGHTGVKHGAVSTGSLAWDYLSGIGGHPMGALSEVFGAPSIGKSTVAANGALRCGQAEGLLTGVIAVEPDVDEDWMERHGVNLEHNILTRPDTGEEAFGILHDWVYDGSLGLIVFDSVGALSSEKEHNSDSVQAYGNSSMITWGIKRIVARAWKNDIAVLFINQQRDDTKSKMAGLVDSSGGWAFKHLMSVRTHLKPGKERYTVKMPDGEKNADVLVGRQLIASFKKNKKAEALGRSARFDFFHMETDQYPFGIDIAKDILSAAKLSGVFVTNGAWINHSILPGGKVNGQAKLADWMIENPDKVLEVREEVLKVMEVESAKKADAKRRAKLKAV